MLLEEKYVSENTTYMFHVREPGGELLARFDAAETPNKYYYHFDNLGSKVLVTNGSGTVTDTYKYDAWGNVTHTYGSTSDNPYQYVGQLGYYTHYQEPTLELGVRFYDPGPGEVDQTPSASSAGGWRGQSGTPPS